MSNQIEPLTPEVFEELREKHGDLFEVETNIGVIYVRRPTKHEFRRALKKVRADDLNAQDELVCTVAVHPDKVRMQQLCDRYPALSTVIGDVLADVARGDEEALAKKPSPSSPKPGAETSG